MPNIRTSSDREVGRVTAVSNYSVTVLLDPEVRSQVRSYTRQLSVVTQVGGYLLFPVGPGEAAVGIIVWASENEAVEPDEKTGVTLRLARPRRLLKLNLLGLLKEKEPFKPGVSSYPNLETPALLPSDEELKTILEYRSKDTDKSIDAALAVGASAVYGGRSVTASYNDLLGRPLGIIGNTGSGKSWTVASMLQGALKQLPPTGHTAKVVILDINGEYGSAFSKLMPTRRLNEAYVDGKRLDLPLWAFNLSEIEAFFGAAEASQKPVLERVVTGIRVEQKVKTGGDEGPKAVNILDTMAAHLGGLHERLCDPSGMWTGQNATNLYGHLREDATELIALLGSLAIPCPLGLNELAQGLCVSDLKGVTDHSISGPAAKSIRDRIWVVQNLTEQLRIAVTAKTRAQGVTADSPIPFSPSRLDAERHFMAAVSRFRGQQRIMEYIATLRLRIHRQLADSRWQVFTAEGTTFKALVSGLLGNDRTDTIIVDCSMLANDVLPFFCAVLGRIILELREHAAPEERTVQPFVLVLEEAHNYLKPPREYEPAGIRLSRETFERIAKEGRKFGLSLVVASQRPSDVSATVLSQCANFVVHRIQNPDDIDFFKRILPLGSRDLLDQVPILAPGDALLMGSAVNVPVRVRIRPPDPPPTSETPKPWRDWQPGKPQFNVDDSLKVWLDEAGAPAEEGGATTPNAEVADTGAGTAEEPPRDQLDDIPF